MAKSPYFPKSNREGTKETALSVPIYVRVVRCTVPDMLWYANSKLRRKAYLAVAEDDGGGCFGEYAAWIVERRNKSGSYSRIFKQDAVVVESHSKNINVMEALNSV